MSEMSAEIHTQSIEISRAKPTDPKMECFQALPGGEGPFPGIIIIHEIFGLNDNIRDIAGRFARQGYAVLAIDLFSGVNRVTCLMQIFYALLIRPIKNAHIEDLKAALDFFQKQAEIDEERTGVVGFCMGGSYALQLASVQGDLRAASVFYGQNPRPLDAVARVCPIVGSYPGKDFTAKAARQLQEKLDEFDVPHDIKIYPGTRHSFFNDQSQAYAPVAAHDAWQRMLSFFEKHLVTN
jgi:carboxymethylenebutenolidase